MKLDIKKRLAIQRILPQKGSLTDQIICKDIQKRIAITAEEIKKVELVADQASMRWNAEKDKPIDIEFTGAEINQLKDAVKALDSSKEITTDLVDLCVEIKELSNEISTPKLQATAKSNKART